MYIGFVIPGPPQGKARPRVVRMKNGASVSYTPDKTVAYEELVRQVYRSQNSFVFENDVPIQVSISALFPIPKSASRKKREDMLSGRILPTKKPDCDNIAKIICDALNGIAYHDDSQIVRCVVDKRFDSGTGHVCVCMMEVDCGESENTGGIPGE